MSAKTPVEAVVTRHFDAPAERVFDAWLRRESIARWMFGPAVRKEEIVRLSLDPRVGGAFSFRVERDGETINHLGKYLEIERPHRLVFSWIVDGENAGSRVRVEIAAKEDGCELTLTQELHPAWAAHVERAEAAWAHMFDVLAETLT